MMRMQQHFVGRGGGLIRAPGGVSTLERPEVPRSLSLAGFEGQIAFSFYFRDYRWAYFWQGILQTSPVGNTDLSYKASLAVATGYLGKAKKDLDLESKATELSSVAVKAVQFTLDRGLKSDFPGLLAVITALGVYNYVVDNKFHYLHHYGAQMIMKTCGPGYFHNEPYLTVFRHCRMMLYCCCVAFKCRTFLSRPEWKSVPFLHVQKTTEDQLMDVLLHIPGLLESTMAANQQTQDKGMLLETICCQQFQLDHWRNDWTKLNLNSAISIPISHGSHSLSPFLASYLSSGIRTNTTQQAIELICYHSAMFLLGQLKRLLEGHGPKQDIITSIAYHEAVNSSEVLPNAANPLLLPDRTKMPWQHGLEGLRILAGFCGGSSSNAGLYLAFAPIGILYCFSEYLGIQQMVISMISGEDWAEDAEQEMGPYRLFSLDALPSEQGNVAEIDSSFDRSSVAQRLFINNSWP